MKKFLLLLVLPLVLAGCTDNSKATDALYSAGYTDITITGYKVFGCGDDDQFHTGFIAKNPQGRSVEGVVCSGWFKGGTIRF